jgi:hypothetical protein
MSWYICEIAMFHKEFVSTRPSVMARSALALARCILGRNQPAYSEWSAEDDSFTMISLSQQLHRPSQVLSKKYSSSHYASVAVTMETFLARQASIARSYAAPPTPPCELSYGAERKAVPSNADSPHTPQKGDHQLMMPNGVLTPPITPDGECFNGVGVGAYNARGFGIAPPRFPVTPSFVNDYHTTSF